jgi:hypothetical protein
MHNCIKTYMCRYNNTTKNHMVWYIFILFSWLNDNINNWKVDFPIFYYFDLNIYTEETIGKVGGSTNWER